MKDWLAKVTAKDTSENRQIEFILTVDGWKSTEPDLEDITESLSSLFPMDDYSPADGKVGGKTAVKASKWLAGFAALSDVRVEFAPDDQPEGTVY